MLVVAFRALARHLFIVSAMFAAGFLLVWLVDGWLAAVTMLELGVARMKAPWIWMFGYGLASFVTVRGRALPIDLRGILKENEATLALTARVDRSTRHRAALRYTTPITALGAVLTVAYGIPQTGVSRVLAFLGICAIYYIAAFLLFHFVEITLAFHDLSEALGSVEFRRDYSPLFLEHVSTYLALTTTLGLLAIYSGFRGSLTAGFLFHSDVWRSFLLTPLVLFLPGTLFYNYYPRYVLRNILQHRVFRTMERLGNANESTAHELVVDLRESAVLNSQILPFLDYKSLPSYLLAILFAVSLAYNADPAVRTFFSYLLAIGSSTP